MNDQIKEREKEEEEEKRKEGSCKPIIKECQDYGTLIVICLDSWRYIICPHLCHLLHSNSLVLVLGELCI
jgi:broad-specificity NMP kinase